MRTVVVGISLWLVAQTPAVAQDAQQYSLALKAIRDTANDVCDRVSQEGQQSETKLSGDVEAKLNGVIGKVADLGLKGTGEFQKEQTRA